MKKNSRKTLAVFMATISLASTVRAQASYELVADLSPGENNSVIDFAGVDQSYLYFYKRISQSSEFKYYRFYRLNKNGVIQEVPLANTVSDGDGIPNDVLYDENEIWVQNSDLSIRQVFVAPEYNSTNNEDTTRADAQASIFVKSYENGYLNLILERVDKRYSRYEEPELYFSYELVSVNVETGEIESIDDDFTEALDDDLSVARWLFYFNGQRYSSRKKDGMGEEIWLEYDDENGALRNSLTTDINPGAKSAFASNFRRVGDHLYFHANNNGDRELYRMGADGVSKRVKNINATGSAFVFDQYEQAVFHTFNDQFFFIADDGENSNELWSTDGSEAGTELLNDINPGADAGIDITLWGDSTYRYQYNQLWYNWELPNFGFNHGDGFYFRVDTGENSIWYSDGTSSGTRKVMDEPGWVYTPFAIDDSFLVSFNDLYPQKLLYRLSDENGIAPEFLMQTTGFVDKLDYSEQVKDGSALLIIGNGNDFELWISDGTKDGTSFLKTVGQSNSEYESQFDSVVFFKGQLYFVAYNEDSGREMWVTDGTADGTHILKDIDPGAGDGIPEEGLVYSQFEYYIRIINDELYFLASNGTNLWQVWKTDGTEAGTVMTGYTEEFPRYYYAPESPKEWIEFNGSYYFVQDGDGVGTELFKYTPESAGTTPSVGTGAMGDFVWVDTNADGIQDASELGLEGVRVQLQSCSGDFVATTTTDSMGAYRFDNVAEDHFQLQFMLPTGYEFSPEKATSEYQKDSNADPTTGVTPCYDMTTGYKRMAVDAGMVPVASTTGDGVMGDYVWKDSNGDGVQDANENGLEGITVNLQSCSGSEWATTITDGSGAYLFENIGNGDYRLEFELPAGFSFSPEKSTDQFKLDSNADETTGLTPCYNMDEGWKRRAIDVGMIPDGSGSGSDTLIVVKAIYFSSEQKLWLRVSSDAESGTANLTASAEIDGANELLGLVGWKSTKGFYQTNFKNLSGVPASVTLTSDMGGSVTAEVEVF